MSDPQRVRIRFAKLGKVRWTSHRDVARMWERAFRRVGFPVAYSGGFSPRPKVSFGLALPTGHESVAEYLDVETDPSGSSFDLAALPVRLSAALPVGVDALAAVAIEAGTPSLQEDVTLCTWRWAVVAAEGRGEPLARDLAGRVGEVLAASSVTVSRLRKGSEVVEDIRPAIEALRVLTGASGPAGGGGPAGGSGSTGSSGPAVPVWLEADLATQPRSIRPSDVLAALGPGLAEQDVRRLHQWISRNGARWEPIGPASDATGAPRAMERAS
ncbi:MAG TPA: TIGR03936 family radical SAM-associated protein [Acidimicrobiales bacterium]|jgi:radical SAM-linked protein|nr:TIGR03936 family radical SAM-associated protein [Acidimicrobiales bacterium]